MESKHVATVSVVIPAYNSAKFIRCALESIYQQTKPPAEIIVVDHASTDETASIAKELAASSPLPVKLIHLSRNSGGPASALNVGVAAASGEFIATLDHDDVMLPDKLEMQVACLKERPGAALCVARCIPVPEGGLRHRAVARCNAIVSKILLDAGDGEWGYIPARSAYDAMAMEGCYVLTCSNMIFRRTAWKVAGGYDEKNLTAPDFDLLEKLTRQHELAFVNRDLVKWTAPPTSHWFASSRARRLQDELRVYERIDRKTLSEEVQPAFGRRLVEETLGAAYLVREEGDYVKAAKFYLKAARLGHAYGRAGVGIMKLLPHLAIRRIRSIAGTHSAPCEERPQFETPRT